MTVVPLEYYFQTLNHCGVIFCVFYHFFFLHCSIYRERPHARVNVSQEPLSPRSSVNSRRCSIFDHPPATRLHFVNFFPNPNRVFDVDR